MMMLMGLAMSTWRVFDCSILLGLADLVPVRVALDQ